MMPELSTQCSVNVICENNTGLDNIDIGDKIFFGGGGVVMHLHTAFY